MKVSVTGHHMQTGESLQTYVNERIEYIVDKYFENAISAHIVFSKAHHLYHCEIIVNDGTKRHDLVKSEAECDEPYSSFDNALGKLEKQLRRHKSRLKDRHNKIKVSEISSEAIKYIINKPSEEQFEDLNTVSDQEDHPLIIAEKPLEISTMSVSDAVMRMDLEDVPTKVFYNKKTQRINVVYYRPDGNIAWVQTV